MDLGVDLLHGDGEGAVAVAQNGPGGLGEREGVDEGWKLQRVEHGGGLPGALAAGVLTMHRCHRHLGESAVCAVEQADGGGLLQEGASRRGQRNVLRLEEWVAENRHASRVGDACLRRYRRNVTVL